MNNPELKEFVQQIQNKISIAVALAVIRSTPKDMTPFSYAQSIQEKCMRSWYKTKGGRIFERRILELQQEMILEKVSELIPLLKEQKPEEKEVDDTDSSDGGSDFLAELRWPEIDAYPSFSDSDSDHESEANKFLNKSMNFVEAMVKLKYAIESSSTPAQNNTKSGNAGSRKEHFSDDSGFCDFILKDEALTGITLKTYRDVTHSYKTEAVIRKCLEILFLYVKNTLTREPIESFRYWKESILQKIFALFNQASRNSMCSDLITTFIIEFLEDVWVSKSTGQLLAWEYQLKIMSEAISNNEICESVIQFIRRKFSELTTAISKTTDGDMELTPIIEKAPFFIDLLFATISKRVVEKESNQIALPYKNFDDSVADLWKKHWKTDWTDVKEEPELPTRIDDHKWKKICDALVVASTERFPLLAIYLSEKLSS